MKAGSSRPKFFVLGQNLFYSDTDATAAGAAAGAGAGAGAAAAAAAAAACIYDLVRGGGFATPPSK